MNNSITSISDELGTIFVIGGTKVWGPITATLAIMRFTIAIMIPTPIKL